MQKKTLEQLKNGTKITSALVEPMMFEDLRRATFLDGKTLQACLSRLVKHGYVSRDTRGLWCVAEEAPN